RHLLELLRHRREMRLCRQRRHARLHARSGGLCVDDRRQSGAAVGLDRARAVSLHRRDPGLHLRGGRRVDPVLQLGSGDAAARGGHENRQGRGGIEFGRTTEFSMARRYEGKVGYFGEGGVETGREFFSVTVETDGTRTLRSLCEMDQVNLIRDVTYTV